jgi:hypothetical protein
MRAACVSNLLLILGEALIHPAAQSPDLALQAFLHAHQQLLNVIHLGLLSQADTARYCY